MNIKSSYSSVYAVGAALALILCFESGYSSAQEKSLGALPMFGRPAVTPTEFEISSDEAFIRSMTAKFGSREAGSQALAARGWEQIRGGRLSAALDTFNQSWLLNSRNHEPYWGFGAVLSEQGKFLAAIEQLERARELIDDGNQLVQLLADIGAVRSAHAVRLPQESQLERAQQFSAANQRFAESLEIDPEYAASWREWAISLFEQERYSEAWIKAARARELKAEPFPADFLSELKSKTAEPK